MITYWNQNATTILTDTAQHAQLVLTSLLIALLIATLLILLCLRHDRLLTGLTYVFSCCIRCRASPFSPCSYR